MNIYTIYIYISVFFSILQSLCPALLNVREMCYRISDMGLCRVEKNKTYSLDEFRQAQFDQLREVCMCIKFLNIRQPQVTCTVMSHFPLAAD